MYRRNPTNYPGPVVMDCGRPADGYYAQKYPCKSLNLLSSGVPYMGVQMYLLHMYYT